MELKILNKEITWESKFTKVRSCDASIWSTVGCSVLLPLGMLLSVHPLAYDEQSAYRRTSELATGKHTRVSPLTS